jgi:RIO kinase 2
VRHEAALYDGYKLTYSGYDYLALHTLSARSIVSGVGTRIGVGKESDVYAATSPTDQPLVIKFHRLGRTSFRGVKEKRDYLRGRTTGSWLYLSRLAAMKEYAFMKALYAEGFPVPQPMDWNRHAVVMERVDGWPLSSIRELNRPDKVFRACVELLIKLAEVGLIHGDFNEFNIILKNDDAVVFIDFPQMVSTSHPNAGEMFLRDLECLREFFRRRFRYETEDNIVKLEDIERAKRLDEEVEASGWTKDMEKEFVRENAENATDSQEEEDDEEEGDDEQNEDEEESEDGTETETTTKVEVKAEDAELTLEPEEEEEEEEEEESENDEENSEEISEEEEEEEKVEKVAVDEEKPKGKSKKQRYEKPTRPKTQAELARRAKAEVARKHGKRR